jgi:hypothetical protein
MWRRLGLPVVVGLAVTAGLAAADSGSRPAPVAQSSARAAVHLPKVSHCIRRNVRLTVLPPAGTSFTSLSVRVADDEIMQLSGLSGPGSVKVTLPSGRSRVAASGTTSDGRFVRSSRVYHRCVPHPKPPNPAPTSAPTAAPTPVVVGGGDDGP